MHILRLEWGEGEIGIMGRGGEMRVQTTGAIERKKGLSCSGHPGSFKRRRTGTSIATAPSNGNGVSTHGIRARRVTHGEYLAVSPSERFVRDVGDEREYYVRVRE